MLRDRLAALVSTVPDGTLVPVRWLAELLAEEPTTETPVPALSTLAADFTVAEVAARFGKGTSTVRTWLARGELPGAYRMHGREWRIPLNAVEALQRAQAAQHRAGATRTTSSTETTDLGAWRRHQPTARPA